MRGTLAVLVVLGLFGQVGAGSAVVAADHAGEISIDGTVTGIRGTPAGDATVLVGEDAALTERSPAELRAAATDPPQELRVVAVGSDGRFAATVDSRRAEAAVAVSDAGISDLVYVRGENATLSMQLHERRPQTVHAHLGAVAADERRAELYVSAVNSDDTAVENLSVRVGPLPDGWTVTDVRTDGQYRQGGRTLTWASVAPGGDVDTTVVLRVPPDTAPGEYTVGLRAESDTHLVDVAPETVEVLPEETATPTRMRTRSGEARRTTAVPTTTRRQTGEASAPGFGPVPAVAALALIAALLVRRR